MVRTDFDPTQTASAIAQFRKVDEAEAAEKARIARKREDKEGELRLKRQKASSIVVAMLEDVMTADSVVSSVPDANRRILRKDLPDGGSNIALQWGDKFDFTDEERELLQVRFPKPESGWYHSSIDLPRVGSKRRATAIKRATKDLPTEITRFSFKEIVVKIEDNGVAVDGEKRKYDHLAADLQSGSRQGLDLDEFLADPRIVISSLHRNLIRPSLREQVLRLGISGPKISYVPKHL